MKRMSEHTGLISSHQLLITAACANTGSKMKGSHSRAADRCPFVPRHSWSQVTSFMQLGMLWYYCWVAQKVLLIKNMKKIRFRRYVPHRRQFHCYLTAPCGEMGLKQRLLLTNIHVRCALLIIMWRWCGTKHCMTSMHKRVRHFPIFHCENPQSWYWNYPSAEKFVL